VGQSDREQGWGSVTNHRKLVNEYSDSRSFEEVQF